MEKDFPKIFASQTNNVNKQLYKIKELLERITDNYRSNLLISIKEIVRV